MFDLLKRRRSNAEPAADEESSVASAAESIPKKVKLGSTKKGTPIPGNTQWDLIMGKMVRDLDNPLNSVRSAHGIYGNIFTYVYPFSSG